MIIYSNIASLSNKKPSGDIIGFLHGCKVKQQASNSYFKYLESSLENIKQNYNIKKIKFFI